MGRKEHRGRQARGVFLRGRAADLPLAPGMFERALPIDGLNLQAITPFAIELHDIIITKLGRYHAKDRSDIELLTRIPGFHHERLTEPYARARDDLKTYWPDKLEKIDRNFNLVRTAILGLPLEDWGDGHD
jgi:hypothetical protein